MVQYLTAEERETTVVSTDADEQIVIESTQRRYITRLRKHRSFTEVASGYHGGTEWARFTIPAREWNPATGAKRRGRTLSDGEKAQAVARLRENTAKRRRDDAGAA